MMIGERKKPPHGFTRYISKYLIINIYRKKQSFFCGFLVSYSFPGGFSPRDTRCRHMWWWGDVVSMWLADGVERWFIISECSFFL